MKPESSKLGQPTIKDYIHHNFFLKQTFVYTKQGTQEGGEKEEDKYLNKSSTLPLTLTIREPKSTLGFLLHHSPTC